MVRKYIFAIPKVGAIAHPDSYREVEQRNGNARFTVIPLNYNQGIFLALSMDFICYIIYSQSLNRYYVGHTSNFTERLKMHNDGCFGSKSYTSKAQDWKEFLLIPCSSVELAVYLELRIKRMKSRKYKENLKKYPEIIQKIVDEFDA